jgi:hypothetical protein
MGAQDTYFERGPCGCCAQLADKRRLKLSSINQAFGSSEQQQTAQAMAGCFCCSQQIISQRYFVSRGNPGLGTIERTK